MSILIRGKKKFIIDRTILEDKKLIYDSIKNKKYIKYFLQLLNGIGVDLVEVDKSVICKIGMEKSNINFAYVIKNEEDTLLINEYDFKYVILDIKLAKRLHNSFINCINKSRIILEVDEKNVDEIFKDESYEIFNNFNVVCIRLKNVKEFNFNGYGNIIRKIKNEIGTLVDFCASDEYFMATPIDVEACNDGADFITTAFNGGKYKFASLEEVILILKVIKKAKILGDLRLIKKICEVYERLCGEEIACMKPVIGKDIFKCESGVHVNGIEKASITYEPYAPLDIGAEREIIIGKHSGRRAIEIKLEELNIKLEDVDVNKFLGKIREKSIELHRNILDDEFKKIYYSLK